jgi:hypothetical protein
MLHAPLMPLSTTPRETMVTATTNEAGPSSSIRQDPEGHKCSRELGANRYHPRRRTRYRRIEQGLQVRRMVFGRLGTLYSYIDHPYTHHYIINLLSFRP